MPPQDFVLARQASSTASSGSSEHDNGSPPTSPSNEYYYRTTVEGQPYLPTLRVELKANTDPSKVRRVLFHLVQQMFGARQNGEGSFDETPGVLSNDNDKTAAAAAAESLLQVQHIAGGCTNTLFRLDNVHAVLKALDDTNHHDTTTTNHYNNNLPGSLLCRIFGAEGLIDRDVETWQFCQLARAGLSPSYHGAFSNGRLEGWRHGMRALTPPELQQPHILSGIARRLAELHHHAATREMKNDNNTTPLLWPQLDEWYAQSCTAQYQTDADRQRAQERLHYLPQIQAELAWLRAFVIPTASHVCFCHNDVLAANVLYREEGDDHHDNNNHDKNNHNDDNRIQLIDFEYGGFNYASFDIANHWNEWASGPPFTADPNYDDFPTTEQQLQFCHEYWERAQEIRQGESSITCQELHQQVLGFVLVNHLYWGLWAVNQANVEGTQEFDYLQYAIRRLDQYWLCKTEQQQQD